MKAKTLALAAALAAISLAAQAQAPQYTVTELGLSPASSGAALSSLSGSAAAISSSGNYVVGRTVWQDAGSSTIYGPNYTWSASTGSLVDWAMPSGRYGASTFNTSAVNNHGLAVGSLGTNIGNASLAPYMANGSTVTALALPSGQVSARVSDVNDSGKAVGQAGSGLAGLALMYDTSNPGAAPTAISAVTGVFTATSLTGTSYTGVASMTVASQINNAGYVVGTGYLAGATQALVPLAYDSATGNLSFIDLTSLGGVGIVAINGLSENGWITGTYNNVAFRWKEDIGVQAIPMPGGVTGTSITPYAINSSGQVVGKAGSSSSAQLFYFDGSGSYTINSMIAGNNPGNWSGGGSSPNAYGIADDGSIVITGISAGLAGQRALLLTPVPEPTTWALMLAGMLGVGAVVRRRTGAA